MNTRLTSRKKIAAAAITVLVITGCASGLNSQQKREYAAMEQKGVLIKEKSPGTGVALGFLPGGGSFYAREPGLGVVNLLFWPLSMFWDPISGYDGAMAINYDLTRYTLKQQKENKLDELDDQLKTQKISNDEYLLAKRKIDREYDY